MTSVNVENLDLPQMNLSVVAYRHFFWVYLDRNIDKLSLNKVLRTDNFVQTYKSGRAAKDHL